MKKKLLRITLFIVCIAGLTGGRTVWAQAEKIDLDTAISNNGDAAKPDAEEIAPGDKHHFTLRTDNDISTIEAGDVYRNETKTLFKVVEVRSKNRNGGRFVVERTAGGTDPSRKLSRVAGSGPANISLRATVLELYLAGGFIMHPLLLMGFITIVLALNCAWVFRRKVQCPKGFVDESWAALQRRDLAEFDTLARKEKGMFPAICRALVDRWDTSTIEDVESRVVSVASAQINRLRIPIKTLNLIAAAAPLVGLLGTIVGMVLVFEAVAGAAGAEKAQALAAGIRVKLFCTAMALSVAIPALFSYFIFNQMLSSLIAHCELLTEQFLHQIKFLKRKFGMPGAEAHERSVHFTPADRSLSQSAGVGTAVTDQP